LKIDPRVLTLLPGPLVRKHRCVPISFLNNRRRFLSTSVIAMGD